MQPERKRLRYILACAVILAALGAGVGWVRGKLVGVSTEMSMTAEDYLAGRSASRKAGLFDGPTGGALGGGLIGGAVGVALALCEGYVSKRRAQKAP